MLVQRIDHANRIKLPMVPGIEVDIRNTPDIDRTLDISGMLMFATFSGYWAYLLTALAHEAPSFRDLSEYLGLLNHRIEGSVRVCRAALHSSGFNEDLINYNVLSILMNFAGAQQTEPGVLHPFLRSTLRGLYDTELQTITIKAGDLDMTSHQQTSPLCIFLSQMAVLAMKYSGTYRIHVIVRVNTACEAAIRGLL